MLWQADIQVGRTPVGALQNVAFAILIELQAARQHLIDPGSVQFGKLRIVRLQRLAPFLVGLTQPLALGSVEFFQTLGKGFLENGNGEERAGDLDERQPVVVQVVIAHAAPPFMADSGTRKTTATGKVRSSSLA